MWGRDMGHSTTAESYTRSMSSARLSGTSPPTQSPTFAIQAHDRDDGIMRKSHDCVKPGVIRAETGLGEPEFGHELSLPHISLSGPQQRSGDAPVPLLS
jgi:hypothetical protein